MVGGNKAGYYLDSIEVTVDDPTSSATAIAGFIYSSQSGAPYQELKELTFKAADSSGTLYVFEVGDTNLILEANRRYFVVFTSTLGSGDWDLDTTNSDGQDGGATGWSMDNSSLESTDGRHTWSQGDNGRVLRIEVNGDQCGNVVSVEPAGSVPAGQGGYRAGDDIRVRVTFSENIDLGANSEPPQLQLRVGDTSRRASCAKASVFTLLVCTYRVQAGEYDLDGVEIPANGLSPGTNGHLQSEATGRALDFTYDAQGPLADHKVEEHTPPVLKSASVSSLGTVITLEFDEALDATNPPHAAQFTVTADGESVTVNRAYAADEDLFLEVPTIWRGQQVDVEYTDPSPGDNLHAIQNRSGFDAASFTARNPVHPLAAVPYLVNNSTQLRGAAGARDGGRGWCGARG